MDLSLLSISKDSNTLLNSESILTSDRFSEVADILLSNIQNIKRIMMLLVISFFIMSIVFIFVDLQMPILDGYTATKEIRRLEKFKNKRTPIIALTAYALTNDKEKCLEAGMDDYLSKPINFNEICNKIDQYLV